MSEANRNKIPPMVFHEKVTFKPLGDNVLIEPEEQERKTQSGLVLPGNDQTKPLIGRIVEVGPGRLNELGKRVPMPVKKGQRIIFHRYEGAEVKAEGGRAQLILELADILAVVEGA